MCDSYLQISTELQDKALLQSGDPLPGSSFGVRVEQPYQNSKSGLGFFPKLRALVDQHIHTF